MASPNGVTLCNAEAVLVGLKGISWGVLALVLLVSSEAAASNYVEAVGSVSIDKTCRKTTISDLKVLVTEETPMGYGRPRWVQMDEKGLFTLLVSKSYKYSFQVKLKAEGYFHLDGNAVFDPTYAENRPALVAKCWEEEVKKT